MLVVLFPALCSAAPMAASPTTSITVVTALPVMMMALALLPLYRLAAIASESGAGGGNIDIAGLQLEAVDETRASWLPDYPYATKTRQFVASRRGVTADVYLAGYFNPRDASEMVTSGNNLAGDAGLYKRGGFSRQIESLDGSVTWRFSRLASRTDGRLVAEARQVEGAFVSGNIKAKLLQARATLLWSQKSSGVILISVPVTRDFETAEADLTRFIEGADLTGLFVAGADDITPPQSGER